MNIITPQELNWVEKRGACTAEKIFAELVAGIMQDVKVKNTLGADAPFTVALTSDQKVLIVAETGNWARTEKVRLFPMKGQIEVRDEITPANFSAQVFLNDEGRCKLRLEDGTELEQWQFRRKILEGLLFGD